MPRGVMIHAMHQFNEFNDTYIDNKYDISDEQYYYGSNKRKRKTAAPQKREPTEEDSREDVKMIFKNSPFGPINLVTKENNVLPSSLNGTERSSEILSDGNITASPEHVKLYAAMLNYFLLKYKTSNDLKSGSFSTCPSLAEVNHGFDKTSGSSLSNNLSNLFYSAHLNHSTNPVTVTSNKQSPSNGSYNDELYYSNSKEIDKLYKHISTKFEAYLDWRQNVINSISTCITNIPVPKSNCPNYEAMSVCYKSLIDRAYALQQSVELYFGMIQNSLSYNSLPHQHLDDVTINSPVHNPTWGGQTNNITNFPVQPPYTSSSYSSVNLSAVLTDIFQSNNTAVSNQELINEYKRVSGVAFEQSNQLPSTYVSESQAQTSLQLPVDLTNSEKNKTTDPFILTLPSHVEAKAHNSDKSNKENHDYCANKELDRCDPVQKSEHSRIPTLKGDGEYTFSNATEHNMVSNVDVRNGFVSQNLKHAASNMLCSSIINCSPRSNINIRKKVYFKSKRVKKSFTSNSVQNNSNVCPENSSPKKSNFRGTSEEENKVAPNFKPIEVNSQILLSEAHPNVKLSKDIFYSLIVKSSGSATRLIRLLMKSFFTQDELAASSLSGEGIYKQRLEPSVTEAIKIFIRQRHPQLKTGSINLCMTDVCVQARRVANNQRSRQHPLRNSPIMQESLKSHRNCTNDQEECDNLLGLKSRTNNSIRLNSTGKLQKHNHDIITTTTTTSIAPTTNSITNEYDSNYCIEMSKSEINDTHFSESENDEPILQIVDERNETASDNVGTPASCSVNSFMSDQK
ncbi:unnamed protein product [Schistosoma intercalatum]|nr:unnamed protein product [Schistosoma intercalatum]